MYPSIYGLVTIKSLAGESVSFNINDVRALSCNDDYGAISIWLKDVGGSVLIDPDLPDRAHVINELRKRIEDHRGS